MNVRAKIFEDLIVWQRAHQFVLTIYMLTSKFPKSELYGLVPQLRRAAVSIAANIAEGFKKRGRADKLRYLNIAQGSAEECHYYLILARDLKYININSPFEQIAEVGRLLAGYHKAILNSNS